jgi:hypothetical protein
VYDAPHATSFTGVDPNEQVDYHFVCFVPVGGHLYELDGRKAFAINHGATTAESFLTDAAQIVREQFMVSVVSLASP